ncbi:hypothetical protein [Ekhidna sp.]
MSSLASRVGELNLMGYQAAIKKGRSNVEINTFNPVISRLNEYHEKK